MPVKTVTAPQVTFRQATGSVSNENGLCQASYMARVDLVCLVCFFFQTARDSASSVVAQFLP